MIGIVLFAERKNCRDRFFFPSSDEWNAIDQVADFIAAAGPKFELDGIWERGWTIKIIDCEAYQAAESAEDDEIRRLEARIAEITAARFKRNSRDGLVIDRIHDRLDRFQ